MLGMAAARAAAARPPRAYRLIIVPDFPAPCRGCPWHRPETRLQGRGTSHVHLPLPAPACLTSRRASHVAALAPGGRLGSHTSATASLLALHLLAQRAVAQRVGRGHAQRAGQDVANGHGDQVLGDECVPGHARDTCARRERARAVSTAGRGTCRTPPRWRHCNAASAGRAQRGLSYAACAPSWQLMHYMLASKRKAAVLQEPPCYYSPVRMPSGTNTCDSMGSRFSC